MHVGALSAASSRQIGCRRSAWFVAIANVAFGRKVLHVERDNHVRIATNRSGEHMQVIGVGMRQSSRKSRGAGYSTQAS